jgi:hypothetical protein
MSTYPLPAAVVAETATDAAKYVTDEARRCAAMAADHTEDKDITGRIQAAIEGAEEAVDSWLDDVTFDLSTLYEPDEDDSRDTQAAIQRTVWGPSVRAVAPHAVKSLFPAEHHSLIDKLVEEMVAEEEARPARQSAEARAEYEAARTRAS